MGVLGRVRAAVSRTESPDTSGDDTWTCPGCGDQLESREGIATACTQCGLILDPKNWPGEWRSATEGDA
jgi:rubredoxin